MAFHFIAPESDDEKYMASDEIMFHNSLSEEVRKEVRTLMLEHCWEVTVMPRSARLHRRWCPCWECCE